MKLGALHLILLKELDRFRRQGDDPGGLEHLDSASVDAMGELVRKGYVELLPTVKITNAGRVALWNATH